jgi:hypothetical protein
MGAFIAFVILVIAGVLVGYYFFPAVLVGTIAVTSVLGAILFATLIAFCIGLFLVFLFSGVGIFVVGLALLVWFIIAIALFPVLFPLLLPLLLAFCVISFLRRRQIKKQND